MLRRQILLEKKLSLGDSNFLSNEIKNIIWNQGTINLVAWLYAPPLKQMLLLRK